MKSKILAATALISMIVVPSAAMAQTTFEIGRQTLLDNGSAPATLRSTLPGTATATGTHSLTCTLEWVSASPTDTALTDFNALSIDNNPSATGKASEPVVGSVTLTYNGRINPKGMAVGDAMYSGSFDSVAVAAAAASPLSCPNGDTLTLGFRERIPGDPGQEEVLAVIGKDALYGTKDDTACMAARKALVDAHNATVNKDEKDKHWGYAYGDHCPQLIDYTNVITAAVDPVEGKSFRAKVDEVPEVKAQTVTYRYAPSNASFSQSGLTVLVEGQTITAQ